MKIIDARGLSCPEPVVLLRSAMESKDVYKRQPWTPAYIIGVVCAIAYVVACCMYGKKRAAKLHASL